MSSNSLLRPLQIITIALLVLAEWCAIFVLVKLVFKVNIIKKTLPATGHKRKRYSYSIGIKRRQMTLQKHLRIASMGFYSVFNILRLMIYYFETTTQLALHQFEDKNYYFLSLFFNITFWVGYGCYILAVLDRYRRIEMIVPKSTKYRVYRVMQLIIGVALLFISVGRSVCHTTWIIYHPEYVCPSILNLFLDLFTISTGLVFVLVELALNIRLVVSCLRSSYSVSVATLNSAQSPPVACVQRQNELDSNQVATSASMSPYVSPKQPVSTLDIQLTFSASSPTTDNLESLDLVPEDFDAFDRIQRQQRRKRLYFMTIQHQMLIYFMLVVIMDLSVIAMFVLAGLGRSQPPNERSLPTNELEAWNNLLVGLHLYFGFKLLDLFLFQLLEARQMMFETMVIHPDTSHPSRKYTTQASSLTAEITQTGAEIVRDGLLPSTVSLSFPTMSTHLMTAHPKRKPASPHPIQRR